MRAGSVVKAGKGAASLSGNNGSLGDGDAEWAVLEWNGRAHFDHTMVDDPPYMPGSQARLSVSTLLLKTTTLSCSCSFFPAMHVRFT